MIVALAVAGVAMAAKPVKGATYRGEIRRDPGISFPISFKVSESGRKLGDFVLADSYPVYCQGAGFPHLGSGGSGGVSKRGTFAARLPLESAANRRAGYVIVTGQFGSGRSVSGKVRTDISGSAGKVCNGSSPFRAKT